MWYTFQDALDIPEADRALVVAYGNLLTAHGRPPHSLQQLYDRLPKPLNWQSAGNIGLRLTQDSDQPGWPTSGQAVVVIGGTWYYVSDLALREVVVPNSGAEVQPGINPEAWAVFEVLPATPVPAPETGPHTENTIDGVTYSRIADKHPRKMYVRNPDGTDLIDFDLPVHGTTLRDFTAVPDSHLPYGAEVRIIGRAHHPVEPSGRDFWMTLQHWGLFGRYGIPDVSVGYYDKDLAADHPGPLPRKPAPTPAPPIEPEATTPAADPLPSLQPIDPATVGFRWFNDDHTPVTYVISHRVILHDFSARDRYQQVLYKGVPVQAYGRFWYRGRPVLYLQKPGSTELQYLFGILETTPDGHYYAEADDPEDEPEAPPADPATDPAPAFTPGPTHHVTSLLARLDITAGHGLRKIKNHVERKLPWTK